MRKLIRVNHGTLTTNTWLVAQACGRRHNDVKRDLQKLIGEGWFGEVRELPHLSVTTDNNRREQAIELTEDHFLFAMPFICGRSGKKGQKALVSEFLRLRKKAGLKAYFLEMTNDEQASAAGRGLANHRWGVPVFTPQMVLPGINEVSP